MSQFPVIDYERHPAFAGIAKPQLDASLDAMVEAIEEGYRTARANDTAQARVAVFDATVAPSIAQLVAAIRPGFSPQGAAYLDAAMNTAGVRMRLRLEEDAGNRKRANESAATLRSDLLDALAMFHRDGFYRLSADDDLVRHVWRATRLERAIMRKKAARHPRRHCNFSLHADSPAVEMVRIAAHRLGILDLASAYFGKPMVIVYVSLELAHDGQDWYQGCYSDVGLPTAKTTYMHFDADRNLLKAMLYLTDVGPDNGPFSYVPGSHLWDRPAFATAVQNGHDAAQSDFAEIDDGGWDYKLCYYRPRFKLQQSREELFALPSALRGSTHFGDDLEDDTELSKELLRQEHAFTGPQGTMVLFDGSQGIHRGGLVRKGQRWVVQIGMAPRDAAPTVRSRLRFFKHSAGNLLRLLGLRK